MKLDDAAASWLDDAVAWWLHELGPIGETLVLPIDEHFRDPSPEGLFASTLKFADMEDWNFELVEEANVPLDVMGAAPHPGYPIPQFEAEDEDVLPEGGPYPIAFRRDEDALGKVASFARDVSHYLLYSVEESGDEGERDAYVDVSAVMMGFGVFLANCAVRVVTPGSGARAEWSTMGVLDEPSLGYLVALFVELRGADDKQVLAHLTPNPRAAFKWARDQLRGPRRPVVERLRAITPAQNRDGPYR